MNWIRLVVKQLVALAISLTLLILPIQGLTQSEIINSNSTAQSTNDAMIQNILVVGDSISAAYGMDINAGWVALLNGKLVAQSLPYRMVNASITGDTTSSGVSRIEALLNLHLPSIVMIELGGNDALRGQSIDNIKNNLQTMINLSHAMGAKVILAEMKIPPNYGPKYTQAFTSLYRDLANQNKGVVLLPFLLENVAINADLMQSDGIHPNKNAQPIIADNVWQTIEAIL